MIRWIILAKEPDCRAGVVLPDAVSGQSPGTLARNLSRCKEGMARVFAVMVQYLLRVGAPAPCERSE
jgi:hypothetical protein